MCWGDGLQLDLEWKCGDDGDGEEEQGEAFNDGGGKTHDEG